MRASYDGKYIYTSIGKIDTEENKIIDPCETPGCKHESFDCNRILFGNSSFKAYDGGFYYNYKNELYYRKDGQSTKLFENTFTSDFEVNEISGEPGLFYIMSVDHEGLMCAGANYLFKVDFDGNLIYEPVIFSEDGYYDTYQMDDHKVIVISCSDVMSIIDLQEQTVDILKEKVGRAAYYEGNIYYNTYYVKDDKFYNKLMRCDENGQNEEELLQDCIRFCFTGEDVFYVKQYGNFTLYKYNISTGKDESVLYLPDLTDEYQKEHSDDDLTGTWILDTKCITYADDMIVVQTFEPEYSGANGYVLLDKNGANPVYCKGIMYGIVPD